MRISPLCLAITLISSVPALADTVTLPRVSVTATGTEQADSETPLSTTTLDEQQLFSKGSPNVGDALRGEAGISVGNDSAQGQNPYLRGLGRERIVLLVDGIRLNSAQPAGSVSSAMTLALAEQLEVVRGSASSLYGTGALGGVINVRLPQARYDETLLTTRATFGSTDKRRQLTGIINTGNVNHALMLGAAVASVDDYNTPAGTADRTGYDSQSLIGQYRFRLHDTELRLSYQQQQDEDLWYPGSRRPHPSRNGNIIIHSPQQIRSLLEAGITQAMASGKLDLRIYRQDMERNINAEADWLQRDIITNKVTFETEGADLRYDYPLSEHHHLSAGLNYWEMSANPDRFMAGPPGFDTFVANNPFQDGRITALGAFVQDSLTLGQVQILTALRHDKVDADATSMNNGTRTSGLNHSDRATSGSLAVMYKASDLLRPYVRLSRAFRAPDMRERYESGVRGDGYFYLGSPEIKAETAQQIELGLKGSNPALQYQVALHYQDINDYISGKILRNGATDPQLPGCSNPNLYCKQSVNLGRATIKGLDASADWQLTEGQWLNMALTVLRGHNNDLNEDLFQMPADELNLGWRIALNDQLQLGAGWRYTARQDRVATQFSRGSENPTDSFNTLDLNLAWQVNTQHDLQLNLTNLTDEEFHEHLTEGQSGTEIKAPGRGLQISWQGQF